MSSKSAGSIKWWARCPSLNVAKAPQSRTTCEAVSDACLHLSHWGLFTSLSSNRCPFKWQWPVRKLCQYSEVVSALAEQFPSSFCRGFSKKTLILPLFTNRLPTLLMFPACPLPDLSSGNLCRYTKHRFRSYVWMWAALSNLLVISLPSIPMCPHTHITWILGILLDFLYELYYNARIYKHQVHIPKSL